MAVVFTPVLTPRDGDLTLRLPLGALYLHDLFPAAFLDELSELMAGLPPSRASRNMYADRHFVRDADLAARLFAHLPREATAALGVRGCCSDLRFIRYPPGGFIAPHTDGVRVDEPTGAATSVSLLLYLEEIPDGEGGETTFLDKLPDACADGEEPAVLCSVCPRAGSILLFPHELPHRGEAVGSHPKVLLRGDLY